MPASYLCGSFATIPFHAPSLSCKIRLNGYSSVRLFPHWSELEASSFMISLIIQTILAQHIYYILHTPQALTKAPHGTDCTYQDG